MRFSLEQYIQNPQLKSNAVLNATAREAVREDYTKRFNGILLREKGNINYKLYEDKKNNSFYAHFKIPSETVEKFYYDVVIKFFANEDVKNTEDLFKYDIQVFSNDPAFVYTYAFSFMNHDLFIKSLAPKMSKKALKKTPEEKNPYLQIGYVKTIYFAYLWMKNRGLNKLNRFRTESSRFSLVALMADIEKADNKIEERQAEGEKLIKKKSAAKKKENPKSTDNVKYTKNNNLAVKKTGTVNTIKMVKKVKKKWDIYYYHVERIWIFKKEGVLQSMKNNNIPLVDEWKPTPDDIYFTNTKDIIVAPVSKYYRLEDNNSRIDYFWIKPKKSYNSDLLRDHCCHYLNYFEKYYDLEKEYFTNMAYIKFYIDYYPTYSINNFIYDINRYIIQSNCENPNKESLFDKVCRMVEHNYSLQLSYKSANNPQLQYTDEHAKALLKASVMMNLCIPLITHFAYERKVADIDKYLLDFYDLILYDKHFSHVDIYSKLYETSISNVNRNAKNNEIIWQKQDIRGKDTVTHSLGAVRNIILNIMPKYTFSQNMVSLNYTSINKLVA